MTNNLSPIKEAAIFRDGKLWTLPRPNRHHNIIWLMNEGVDDSAGQGHQGFVDENGQFLDRKAAAIRAEQCGQLLKPLIAPPSLFSEDLW